MNAQKRGVEEMDGGVGFFTEMCWR